MHPGDIVFHKQSKSYGLIVGFNKNSKVFGDERLVRVLFVGSTQPRYVLTSSLRASFDDR